MCTKEVTMSNRKLSDDQVNEIVHKYKMGSTMAALGREYNIATASIHHHLDRAGARKTRKYSKKKTTTFMELPILEEPKTKNKEATSVVIITKTADLSEVLKGVFG